MYKKDVKYFSWYFFQEIKKVMKSLNFTVKYKHKVVSADLS